MDIDIIFKLGTFVIGAIGTGKILYEVSVVRRGRMREEYKFAREFLKDRMEDSEMHPFLREKGYRAIAGDERLTADEIEYLLSLKGADRTLKDYSFGRSYLEHLPNIGNLQIQFKKKYKTIWSRRWRKWTYFALYLVLAFLMFSPFLLSKYFFKQPGEMLAATGFCLVVFGPYAWMALGSVVRIQRAEKLVEHQDKHRQTIFIDGSGSRSRQIEGITSIQKETRVTDT
ncbi:hypothetical protein WL78_15300 [Burkholderia ubonensis]|uniref:hypothetical protein n=1 Tax=Burkholderia ubonensis TaxID=101571 RepID=UPI0007525B3E|nr:hypothetical protein [Burkholderia ubonensis]KWE70880.1 hypothetical protein WL78_15300 [Burkholderia ubonensis]